MVDIALLVVEDLERRMSSWEKEEEGGEMEFRSAMAMASSLFSAMEAKVEEKLVLLREEEVSKRAMGPRSSVALAAIDGFFSA
ncbi:hypothetical protein AXF42_Ash004091 [Apostasia shenzhenica]|uniref:Uncharacterized protein n=1 Tax=Apostasia shenzhenica TaxID=1088818 RepID=A0A2I0A1W8_9ASPA|nr:hypothetical protein AXF42_Ash004091 [Apostasia shenzhenica]